MRREAPPTATRKRQRAWRRGWWAEVVAALYLWLHGYRLLAWRYQTEMGEIDLIARRRRVVVAVEVKARPSLAEGLEAITPPQRRRIARALESFLQRHPRYASCDCRFDVIVIRPRRWPVHLPDAWRPS